MPAENTTPMRRESGPTYFVGRRLFEAAELYAVTATGVERLRSERRYGEASLDWAGGRRARMELSHLLINRVIVERPTRELQARFALYVLGRLPEGGFVMSADEVWHWLRLAGDRVDFLPARGSRPSKKGRLHRGAPAHSRDA